jgi:hypothetical protein
LYGLLKFVHTNARDNFSGIVACKKSDITDRSFITEEWQMFSSDK